MKHSNIAIFVPHVGCPHKCAFCDQRAISREKSIPKAEDVAKAVEVAINSRGYSPSHSEIAFFGGSFTGIPKDYMIELLSAAKSEIDKGRVAGIRISTRPDFIDSEILDLLKKYSVTTIELGAQSMQDDVLKKNMRGHSAEDVSTASAKIKEQGFALGLQMMTGLYGDTDEKAIDTVDRIIALSPNFVRIYPTIVLKGTHLEALVEKGEYSPQTIEQAVELGSVLLEKFYKAGIPVIRFGLHTIDEDSFVAGPWHPSLSELASSRVYLKRAKTLKKGRYNLFVCPGATSKMIGQKRENIIKLSQLGINCKVMEREGLSDFEIEIEEVK